MIFIFNGRYAENRSKSINSLKIVQFVNQVSDARTEQSVSDA